MVSQRHVTVGNVSFGNDLPLALIAGPCQIESVAHAKEMAARMVEITAKLNMPYVFKASFDKANRTSVSGKRGIGLEAALQVFADIKEKHGCPILTDIHEPGQCAPVAEVCDILQIPAFLSRQTDLIVAAGETGAVVNVKKGQFLAPEDMANVVGKVESTGNHHILLTERGASFGYNTLVVDMRGLPIMAQTGYPVVMDATHAVQKPGGQGTSSGGDRRFAPVLARAAVSTGIAGVFIETHDDPDNAASDGPNMIPVDRMEDVLRMLQEFDRVAKAHPVSLD